MKSGCSVASLCFISLAFSSAAVAVFLWKNPFPVLFGALIVISPIFMYYIPVISRSYCVAFLLLMLVAALWGQRRVHPIAYAVCIALLLQVHILLAGFCLALLAVMVFDVVSDRKLRSSPASWIGIGLIVSSAFALYLELSGGPSSTSSSIATLFSSLSANPISFSAQQLETLNYSLQHQAEIGFTIPTMVVALFVLAVICGCLCCGKRHLRELIVIICALVPQMLIYTYISSPSNQRTSLSWALVLVFLWMLWSAPVDADAPRRSMKAHGIVCGLLAGSLILFVFATSSSLARVCRFDLVGHYSGSTEAAAYIEENLPSDTIIFSEFGPSTVSVGAHATDMLYWNTDTDGFFTYADWSDGKFGEKLTYDEVIDDARANFPEATSIYILATDRNFVPGSANATLLFTNSSMSWVGDERYWLYEVRL